LGKEKGGESKVDGIEHIVDVTTWLHSISDNMNERGKKDKGTEIKVARRRERTPAP